MLQAVCKTHQLPLAQSWVSDPDLFRHTNVVWYEKEGSYITDTELCDFTKACSMSYIKKGRGVVGKAFSSNGACFCKDISQLSINEYSLVLSVRKAGLIGCFAISLWNSSRPIDEFRIVEFFLPRKETENGELGTLIKMVLTTVKQHLNSFKVASGQELGEKLFIQVIKTSPTDELNSFEICDLIGIHSTPNTMRLPHGREMVRLDSATSDGNNVLGSESGKVHGMIPVPPSSHPPVQTGPSIPIHFVSTSDDNCGFATKMHQKGAEAFPADPPIMDSNAGKEKVGTALYHEGEANVLPDANNLHQHGEMVHFDWATSLVENVNNAEQNIVSIEQCGTNNTGEIVQLDDTINNASNMNINSNILKNQRAIKRIKREHGMTFADLLQQSDKKQEAAAHHFGVSRSTFKRICREHEIFRWPPHKLKHGDDPCNTAQGFVQPSKKIVEDLSLPIQPVEQKLNSKQDSSQNAMTVQDGSSIMVKITHRNDMTKFHLPISSGKMALEEEITKRFCLSIGSFSIKYLDEDEDWITIICDADLKTCISIMRSLGKNTVKMLVNMSQDN